MPDFQAQAVELPAIHTQDLAESVMGASVERFYMAPRIASVAKLNTPAGRKPRLTRSKAAAPPLPTARQGAKKLRVDGNQGPRVLRPSAAPRRTAANIVVFPTRSGSIAHQRPQAKARLAA